METNTNTIAQTETKPTTALITGASSGIGLHLAREFAKHGHSLVIVAPQYDELENIARSIISEYGVNVYVIARDLTRPESAMEIADELQHRGISVDILVNNAGFGVRGNTWDLSIEEDLAMVRLNIEAPLRLTKLFLPRMQAANQGWILNTASIAGFFPGALFNVYHSTKAFLLSWSQALASELKGTSIKVTALCPGVTDTDFFTKSGMENVAGFQGNNVMAPQDVAVAGYKALMNGDLIIVPGTLNNAMVAMRRVAPQGLLADMTKSNYEFVPADEAKRKRGDVENKAEAAAETAAASSAR